MEANKINTVIELQAYHVMTVDPETSILTISDYQCKGGICKEMIASGQDDPNEAGFT
ncbi:hypothetical protein [Paenibacillus stellifer]|uniref:hypothetical protein n=1 Tax=Paenibacillus stellifer TaxID=169760 RepID=UPI000B120A72|nr:hypothetical protein [Paenibacillus stellifer]